MIPKLKIVKILRQKIKIKSIVLADLSKCQIIFVSEQTKLIILSLLFVKISNKYIKRKYTHTHTHTQIKLNKVIIFTPPYSSFFHKM